MAVREMPLRGSSEAVGVRVEIIGRPAAWACNIGEIAEGAREVWRK